MVVKIFSTKQLFAFAQSLMASNRVVGPKRKENKFTFEQLSNALELALDYDVTLSSPRVFLGPPKEKILDFTLGEKPKITANIKSAPLVIFGIHTYDLKALNQMDRVWEDGHADEHYLMRRRATTIIALEPMKASKWSFWSYMDATSVSKGFDLLLTNIGERYVIEVGTKHGANLLTKHAKGMKIATTSELNARKKMRKKIAKLCHKNRSINVAPGQITSLLRPNYRHPIWEEQAKKCYSCGSCNLVCPTCYCFDVKDEIELDFVHGKRTRIWDGCLLEKFASVGSGENFRGHCADRFRHRIMRKLVYVPDKIGELACVGCGRCSGTCLPNITDPVFVINNLAKNKKGN